MLSAQRSNASLGTNCSLPLAFDSGASVCINHICHMGLTIKRYNDVSRILEQSDRGGHFRVTLVLTVI